jgi:hypothetical protein
LANCAVPAEQLEAERRSVAGQIAVVPTKVLNLKKDFIDYMLDPHGLPIAVSMGAEPDALLHASQLIEQFRALIRLHGPKGATEPSRRCNLEGESDSTRPTA